MSQPKKQSDTIDVTVLDRHEVTTYPKIGQPTKTVLVTYVGGGLPPTTLFIAKDKYSADMEKKAIREDIERRLKQKPESMKV